MAKSKTKFVCLECGYESVKWLGRCTECGAYNSFVEEADMDNSKSKNLSKKLLDTDIMHPKKLKEIEITKEDTIKTGMGEIDRVLGNGIVKGSLILLGGEPGIGKSTLLLQLSELVAKKDVDVLYVSGEESLSQIKIRADRLGVKSENIRILPETNIEAIVENIKLTKPGFLIIDSIQTIYTDEITSVPGSVGQVREITNILMNISKNMGISTVIIGHVTKEGSIAGPKVLEHMVDTVLYFEGERMNTNRVIRTVKNRFGSTNEIGVFEMTGKGLIEVTEPSKVLLEEKKENGGGSVVTCMLEGTRPMLVEVQALVSKTNLAIPRRTGIGVDYNRLSLLVAIMEKHLGINLGVYDIYVNIVGGIKVNDTAIDLAIVSAILSSLKDSPVSKDTVIVGEVGLLGEVRQVLNYDARIKEASKMGFKNMITSAYNKSTDKKVEMNTSSLYNVKEIKKYI
ncbi:MAG: DNA repair protein RadA [Clostridia bacterium]|nr:DNA repair protein RadA [Clostridia bacterium]